MGCCAWIGNGDLITQLPFPPYQDREAGPQWDCETIVSTFSNLDNHPSVIAEPSRGGRRKNKRGAAASGGGFQGEEEGDDGCQEQESICTGPSLGRDVC